MLASHVIFSAHGFWLPNDPRGSWSDYVRDYELYRTAGRATKVNVRHSVAHTPHDRSVRLAAKAVLKYPPVFFTSAQARVIVQGFIRAIEESAYTIHALTVMPDHAHAVVGAHANSPGQIVGQFKARATQALLEADLHPFAGYANAKGILPQVWAHQAWKVFLDTPEQTRRAIEYVEQNPIRAGMRPQRYSFITPFNA